MQNAGTVSETIRALARVARDGDGGNRTQLFLSLTRLYEAGEPLTATEQALMQEIMRRLIHQVEISVRTTLALRLASDPAAPHELILLLANDRIEVARFVLERSRALTEADLIAIVHVTSTAHQKVIAARPDVTAKLADALCQSTSNEVIEALLHNAAATIAADTLRALVPRLAGESALQEALLKRQDVTRDVALLLYTKVSDQLKGFILQHFDVDPTNLSAAVNAATEEAASTGGARQGNAKLIEKLALAGQLKPAFLVKALNTRQYELFELGLGRLLNLPDTAIQSLLYKKNGYYLALACRALSIDKMIFISMFAQIRTRLRQPVLLNPHEKIECDRVFQGLSAGGAANKLKLLFAEE